MSVQRPDGSTRVLHVRHVVSAIGLGGNTPYFPEIPGKEEYEGHLAEWRRQSAEQREKAERTRAEWEAARERERKEGRPRQSLLSDSHSGWESLGGSVATSAVPVSPSPADARDLVGGEAQVRFFSFQMSCGARRD